MQRLNDNTIPKLMRIAIEGPELSIVDFTEILAVFEEKKHRIKLRICIENCNEV